MLTQQAIRRTASRPGGLPVLAGRSVLCVLPNERLACAVRDALAPAALVFASDGGEALAAKSLLLAREAQLLQARTEEERAIEEELARHARGRKPGTRSS